MVSARKTVETSVRDCYAQWSDSYYDDYYGANAAYPPIHREILRNEILEFGPSNLLDAGCGSASFLRDLADTDLALYGFDLTPEMVSEARRVFKELGLEPERIWQGSVCDSSAYRAPKGVNSPNGFDVAVCCGVLPHIAAKNDRVVIQHLFESVRPGGMVLVEARNALFSMFSLNRYSMDFFRQELIRPEILGEGAEDAEREALFEALDSLKARFRMDMPKIRRGVSGEPGYDEVLSRTHNPFILRDLFVAQGFSDIHVLFYHYHCLPPFLASAIPDLFQRCSLTMEDPNDWRGHFMASAFIIKGIKK